MGAFGGSVDEIQPLEPELWFQALGKLAVRAVDTPAAESESLLRHAFHLLQLAPGPLKHMVRTELSESEYEHLLECEAFESAAIRLIGYPMTYTLMRCQADIVEAEVKLPDSSDAQPVRASNLALATIGSWAASLARLQTVSPNQ